MIFIVLTYETSQIFIKKVLDFVYEKMKNDYDDQSLVVGLTGADLPPCWWQGITKMFTPQRNNAR